MGLLSQICRIFFAYAFCYNIYEVMILKQKLWTRNFCLITLASALGAAGGIAGGFALSFLVFDETGSTLASALVVAVQLIPFVFVPLVAAPWMDRLPRKAFLVGGDLCNAFAYAAMGLWLTAAQFSYIGYLVVSVLLACLTSVDQLAYNSLYPALIPEGAEEKGYAVSSMLYPVMNVVMAPLAAILLDVLGIPMLLMLQGLMCFLAAVSESFICIDESARYPESRYTLAEWAKDIREAAVYLRKEKGLLRISGYMAVTNGMAQGYSPLLVAFFRTAPGFSAAMYSLFSVAEFAGRSIGSALQYRIRIPEKRKFGFTFFVYQIYEFMDMCLLWIPYPLMLVNRCACGFLGSNSAIVRTAAVQRYIPEKLRARVNAFNEMLITAAGSALALAVGAVGELVDYRWCMTLCGAFTMIACWVLVWGGKRDVRRIYEQA